MIIINGFLQQVSKALFIVFCKKFLLQIAHIFTDAAVVWSSTNDKKDKMEESDDYQR